MQQLIRGLSLFILGALTLTGCATQSQHFSSPQRQIENLIIGEPEEADLMNQRALVRISQVLAHVEDMTDEQKAELLYQRGKIYDGFGLRGLAQFDFETALRFKPDLVEAYNFIGIHHTQNRNFVDAYQAFDSALEIDPEHEYAYLNRGIALYYGGRAELAVDDLLQFAKLDNADPYRILWVFIAEREQGLDTALANLKARRAELNSEYWATQIVDFYLGETSQTELLNSVTKGLENQEQLTQRLCELYFYLGKYHASLGQNGVANSYFRLTLGTNVYQYVEHRYARLELSRLQDNKI
ncbi:MAG: lipoprotein NlpI [Aestuariibacter sp.]